jgi:hypothetical protein
MSSKSVIVALALGVAASFLAVAPAHAAKPVPSEPEGIRVIASGVTEDGGWVAYTGTGEVKIDGTKRITRKGIVPMAITTVNVGGGVWSYGSTFNLIGQKVCTSQYQHYSRSHGATSSMNGMVDRSDRPAGTVAYTSVTGWTGATCYAYWRTS